MTSAVVIYFMYDIHFLQNVAMVIDQRRYVLTIVDVVADYRPICN